MKAEGDDPEWLKRRVWSVVQKPGNTPQAYRRALRQAQRAHRLAPQDLRTLLMIGAAQYRVGEYENAIESLERSLAGAGIRPNRWPFLAMAYSRLGRRAEATETYGKLRAVMDLYLKHRDEESGNEHAYWDDQKDMRDLTGEAGGVLSLADAR